MTVLGIESSCDETSASVVIDGREVKSIIIASQIEIHRETNGVVPEVASREHVKVVIPVIKEALKEANITLDEIDLIAVTKGPGLVGSLLVGVETAKTLAFSKNIKIVAVNHILGHIYSNWLDHQDIIHFPILTLTASGGHNDLVLTKDHYDFDILGRTRDDASGEAFDKIAKMLDLPYPGGPEVSKRAILGDKKRFQFPRAWLSKESYEFSFSGLKSAVRREIETLGKLSAKDINDICASFQEAVTEVLATKLLCAAKANGANEIHLAGGVSANSRLREIIAEKSPLLFRVPKKMIYCTDNAAMIASAGFFKYQKFGEDSWQEIEADPRFEVDI